MNWRDLRLTPYRRALWLIQAAAWIAPSASRAEWRREWTGELYYVSQVRPESPVAFARGAFQDAAWLRTRGWNRDEMERAAARRAQSAGFWLAAIGTLLLAITVLSGFLPETRSVLLPLPYPDASRVATATQGGTTLSTRSGIRAEWVRWWRSDSHFIEGAATYSWSSQIVDRTQTLRAKVSGEFFYLLGAHLQDGSRIDRGGFPNCSDCLVLSYDFWRKTEGAKTPAMLIVDGRPIRVAGVLDKRFWFLTRRVGVWEISDDRSTSAAKAGVLLRLAENVSPRQAEIELGSILEAHGVNAWATLISISPLPGRVRSVFGSFLLGLILALGAILPAMRLNFAKWDRRVFARAMFFCLKTVLLLLAILFLGLEFTRAPSITMLGGTDLATEPLSTWLFLLGCMGALSWSIHDQRRRCRVCLRRFELAAKIGCPGCVLLSWTGTELVCMEGHGMLHVPEMACCWQQRDTWTSFDDPVGELFAQER